MFDLDVVVGFITLFTLTHTLLAITLLNEETQRYVDNIIKQFEEDSQRFKHCLVIYPPLPPLGAPKDFFFLPKLTIWSPKEQFEISMKCPEHGTELQPSLWASDVSGKGGQIARLVYDLMGNVILIQRIYLCVNNGGRRHLMRATTPDIHNALPSYIQEYFPAVIFQRCGFTKAMIHFIDTEIVMGVNFLNFCCFNSGNKGPIAKATKETSNATAARARLYTDIFPPFSPATVPFLMIKNFL